MRTLPEREPRTPPHTIESTCEGVMVEPDTVIDGAGAVLLMTRSCEVIAIPAPALGPYK